MYMGSGMYAYVCVCFCVHPRANNGSIGTFLLANRPTNKRALLTKSLTNKRAKSRRPPHLDSAASARISAG